MSNVKTYGKQMPKGEARPLGTKKPTRKRGPSEASMNRQSAQMEKNHVEQEAEKESQKVVDTPRPLEVELPQVEAITPADQSALQKQEHKTMTLTLKTLSKNGKRAIYTGAAQSLAFNLGLFPGKTAPQTLTSFDQFAEKAVKTPKVKLTKEERAALPKPTLAERIAKREAQLAKDKAKLAASGTEL